MEGKEAIINKILEDAKVKADEKVQKAQSIADSKIQSANDWASNYLDAQREILEKDCADLIERRKTVANLDVRKHMLETKQEVILQVFAKALATLRALKKEDYLNLVLRLISENVDKDDQLVLSKDGVLSVEDFASADFIKENNVTISETPGDFVGGVMLIGKSCDKDLTFEAVVESKKDLLASEVAKRLF